MNKKSGFTLIQISIILTVASLVFVATLPGIQTSLKSNAASVTKMNSTVLNTMRGYMAANGYLPCPADPTQAVGASNYGVAAANSGATNNCIGGTPAAAYADTTNHIAIGMVPVKTLGLSYLDALDGYGRNITYAVDTNATAVCWSGSSLPGAITVNDNGVNHNTVAALVSHGADGYGAWLPLSGTSGTASRYDNGSTDTAQADNAQVAHGGGLTANTTFASFVNKAATSTYDDNVVYKSNLYTLNNLPASAQVYPSITPPANATYSTGQVLTFTLTYASNVTVMGTPRLDLSALGAGSIGTGSPSVAHANYTGGSGTTSLTFSYTVQAGDSAPTSGIAVASQIDLNGGNISGGSVCFTAPDLSQVLIGASCPFYRTVTIDHTKVGTVNNTNQTNFPMLFSGTYSYLATVAHGGNVVNANGYDIKFTSDAPGTTLLPYEQESYNATTGAVTYWVQVPTVSHTTPDTVIYLQYCTANQTNQSNQHGTWDANFKAVWHLDESGNGTSGEYKDSTSNANNATGGNGSSSNTPVQTGGKISNAQNFTAASNQWIIDAATNNLPAINGNQTVSFWYYETSAASNQILFDLEDSSSDVHSDRYNFCSGTNLGVYGTSGCAGTILVTAAHPSNSVWHLLTYTWDGTTNRIYFDGAQAASSTINAPSTSSTGVAVFGAFYISGHIGANSVYTGLLDEVKISSSVRSADWIKTEYNNQNSPSTFYTVGAQTSR